MRVIATDRSWQVAEAKAWQPNTPKVSIQMEPQELYDARLEDDLEQHVAKIVGVSDDLDRVQRCETEPRFHWDRARRRGGRNLITSISRTKMRTRVQWWNSFRVT